MSNITRLGGILYKVGAHGFVYRKDGPEWNRSSLTAIQLVEAEREQERRAMREAIKKGKETERHAKRDAKRKAVRGKK